MEGQDTTTQAEQPATTEQTKPTEVESKELAKDLGKFSYSI